MDKLVTLVIPMNAGTEVPVERQLIAVVRLIAIKRPDIVWYVFDLQCGDAKPDVSSPWSPASIITSLRSGRGPVRLTSLQLEQLLDRSAAITDETVILGAPKTDMPPEPLSKAPEARAAFAIEVFSDWEITVPSEYAIEVSGLLIDKPTLTRARRS